ncbi:hypothetical protein M9Y10_042428 [Tritrichomonas musculus]|uniref:Uncharacterized protein n=1 Tax=Tritrichomonas musculus TaxID=1915356 RepID=A0ABR2GPQ4_9EUKA
MMKLMIPISMTKNKQFNLIILFTFFYAKNNNEKKTKTTRIIWNTDKVREEMVKENCALLDEYKRGDIRIRYEYEGKEFSVRWSDWMKKDTPSRPHLKGSNRQITRTKRNK